MPLSVMTTWEVSFKHIKSVNAAPCKPLQIMSLLDFEGIPRELIDSPKVRSHLELQDDLDFDATLHPLVPFSLVSISFEYEHISYRLHRLVGLWTRMQITDTDELVPLTLALVLENFPEPSRANLNQCETYLPQATAVLSYIATLGPLGSNLKGTKMDLQYLMGEFYFHALRLGQAVELHTACYE